MTLLANILKLGGIRKSYIRDLTGESRAGRGRKGIPVGLFREHAPGIDELALDLRAMGYWQIPDGTEGVTRLMDMIEDELRGRRKHLPGEEENEAVARSPSAGASDDFADCLTVQVAPDDFEAEEEAERALWSATTASPAVTLVSSSSLSIPVFAALEIKSAREQMPSITQYKTKGIE